jgi:flagellar motor protein MotB
VLNVVRQGAADRHHQWKVGHGGHHGGAWKVAYADFVTAMMALFIVL